MPTMPSPALALVLLLFAASIAASQAGIICLDSGCFSFRSTSTTDNSAFHANVLTLLEALPQAAAPTGFASLSLGAGRDRAFVRGLCRGDSTPSECLANLRAGVLDSSDMCTSSRSAISWYDKCYITYADTNATINNDYELRSLDVRDIPTHYDPSSHEPEFSSLINRLVARAASAGGTGEAMFATGEAVYAPNGTMYGLAECMRDLSAEECDRCLQLLLTPMPSCCNRYMGGTARNFNCHLRVQAYAYYDLALDAPPPAAPPPGPISSLGLTLANVAEIARQQRAEVNKCIPHRIYM